MHCAEPSKSRSFRSEKDLILIEHAGHFALVTHREEFVAALVKNVRPLALKSERLVVSLRGFGVVSAAKFQRYNGGGKLR
jgi:hypothetical protein